MPSEKVLICGAGIAGSVLAYWLAKHGFEVDIIERSKAEQKAGQGIEIEEPALQVVKAMGSFDELRERRTLETGFKLADEVDRTWATFGVQGFGPTGALELMRGDLTEILYKAADAFSNVRYRFEVKVQGLRQTPHKVIVDLDHKDTKTTSVEEFDFVVGADGVKSRTRELIMGSAEKLDCYKAIGAFIAYFSIPKEAGDWPYSKVCHFPDRRIVWMRPTGRGSPTTSVLLIHVRHDVPKLRRANATGDRTKQKEGFADLFDGLGWKTPRVIEQMMRSDNFYSDELVQVKLERWSQDRVVLVGDSAWAPTPFTGQGNQLAIIGAFVLAQELSRNRNQSAFEAYEKRLRSYVTTCQRIPLGGYMPYIFAPQTVWGVWLIRVTILAFSWIVRIIAWVGLTRFFPDGDQQYDFDLDIEKNKTPEAR